jgi:[protein-PII] uridylyltransferase
MLNEMLLQYFDETILRRKMTAVITPLNEHFQLRDGISKPPASRFSPSPCRPDGNFCTCWAMTPIQGVRASTIRLIMVDIDRKINDDFRNDIRNTSNYSWSILRCKHALFSTLRRMKRYGVLGATFLPLATSSAKCNTTCSISIRSTLIPCWCSRTCAASAIQKARSASGCRQGCPALPKMELLYLAGLFHDIAKGRGGDHSELGAVDAHDFCLHHGLGKWDANLVAWLTQSHLMMSMTAQKKDVSDPDVINEFAQKVG